MAKKAEKKEKEWPKLQKKVLDVLAGLKKLTLKNKLHCSTFTKNLKVDLTPKELLEAGDDLAKVLDRVADLDTELSQVKADFKARITEAEAQATQLVNKVRNKYQYANVDCVEVMDNTTGISHTLRTDKMEIIGDRKLTADERQAKFNWSDGEGDTQEAE